MKFSVSRPTREPLGLRRREELREQKIAEAVGKALAAGGFLIEVDTPEQIEADKARFLDQLRSEE